MTKSPIVSVGFLTQRDLERLGRTFTNHIPVTHDDIFVELLTKLDKIDIEPIGQTVVLRPKA